VHIYNTNGTDSPEKTVSSEHLSPRHLGWYKGGGASNANGSRQGPKKKGVLKQWPKGNESRFGGEEVKNCSKK